LIECATFAGRPAASPHQCNWINVQQERRGAALGRRFGIENMRFAK